MKYSELERQLKAYGCYFSHTSKNGHPIWINPRTGKLIKMSNHKSQEAATGTASSILRAAKEGL